eukprot:TRINITY_DN2043_c0_g1_i4.p1 TRINITY_DN2043_c0_g1~~TRINITY_DN2043_c0_g1_i4.p1  ORF type:complete len:375 (-),score=103.41 TRINITY_DN2043_c0_g1_i4:183-1247(-)
MTHTNGIPYRRATSGGAVGLDVQVITSHASDIGVDIDSWDFNIFTMNPDTVLVDMATAVFTTHNLFTVFNINVTDFTDWARLVSKSYFSNPYHNVLHATEVLQAMHFFIMQNGRKFFSDLYLLAAFFAAIVHDLEHPGVNNNFLVATMDDLAVTYNGLSVLENFHVCRAFKLLFSLNNNWVQKCLTKSQFFEFHSIVTQLVLSTDMARHVETISHVSSRLAGGASMLTTSANKAEVLLLLQVFIKSSDIANSCRPWPVCERWALQVTNEFCMQGDQERQLKLPVSPFMDRNSLRVPKCQSAFIEFVLQPLVELLVKLVPTTQVCLENLHSNLAEWKRRLGEDEARASQAQLQTH